MTKEELISKISSTIEISNNLSRGCDNAGRFEGQHLRRLHLLALLGELAVIAMDPNTAEVGTILLREAVGLLPSRFQDIDEGRP